MKHVFIYRGFGSRVQLSYASQSEWMKTEACSLRKMSSGMCRINEWKQWGSASLLVPVTVIKSGEKDSTAHKYGRPMSHFGVIRVTFLSALTSSTQKQVVFVVFTSPASSERCCTASVCCTLAQRTIKVHFVWLIRNFSHISACVGFSWIDSLTMTIWTIL